MKKAAIFCVGKLRTSYWQEACTHYLKLLAPLRQIECIEAKDSALEGEARLKQEAERLLSCLGPQDLAIALDDQGQQLSSRQFAACLRRCDEQVMKRPCFIIGGPYGLADFLLQKCRMRLSLSSMTWPHELARVLLLEQIYRAESILRGSPYHH